MTSYTWASAVSGNWSTASLWAPSGVPGAHGGDDATISATGADYYVNYNEGTEILNFLTISSANATLIIDTNDVLTVNDSTTFSAGTIDIVGLNATVHAGNLTASSGTTIDIGSDDTLTYNAATLSGLVELTGTNATIGTSSNSLTLNGTLESSSDGGIVNFSNIAGSGTFEANSGTLIVTGSLAGTSTHIIISSSSLSVFETTGALYYGDSLSATFLGPHGEFQYANPTYDTHITFHLTGMNAGTSTTVPTNLFDIGGETITIASGGSGTGTTGNITLSNGDVLALTGITGAGSHTWDAIAQSDGHGGTDIFLYVCYVAGTRILTADGEKPIEALRPGEMIATLSGDDVIQRPIKWIGRRHIDLASHPRPELVAPIRILRDAIAVGTPHRDLLVSPDHAILVDGKLICARQLVNTVTIRQEMGRASVTYLHVEFDAHAIVLAEGLPAESYLDTGNRGFFVNAGEPVALHPNLMDEADNVTRAAQSCLPFAWDEATVRPIWRRLAERASLLGSTLPAIEMTGDPDLCIMAEGRRVRVAHRDGDQHLFVLPPTATKVRLVSRSALPTDARPWLDDRRRLGVKVERITVRSGSEVQAVPIDHPILSQGWWAIEQEGISLRRWTDGDAVLPLLLPGKLRLLEVHASAAGMTYAARTAALRAA